MVEDRELSLAAVSFAAAHLKEARELDVLLRLSELSGRWWDAAALARDLGVTVDDAAEVLHRFAAMNLLDIRVTEQVRYRFAPGRRDLETGARALLDAYRRDPEAVRAVISGEDPRMPFGELRSSS
jgi:hypothetical protein